MVNQSTRKLALFFVAALFSTWCFAIYPLVWQTYSRGELFFSQGHGVVRISDFLQFYKVGKIALSEDRWHAYDIPTQKNWTDRLVSPLKTGETFFAQSAPFMFPLMALVAWMPVELAYLTMMMLGLGTLAVAIFYLAQVFDIRPSLKALACCGLFCSVPAWLNILIGQLSFFMVGFTGAFFAGLFQNRPVIAGLALALSSFKPQYAVALGVFAFATRQWKLIAAAFVFEILLLAVASMTIGLNNVVDYPRVLWQSSSAAGVSPEAMPNMRALLIMVFGGAAFPLSIGLYAIALGAVWFVGSNTDTVDSVDSPQTRWAISFVILVMLLFSPHTHLHDAVLLVIPALLTGDILKRRWPETVWASLIVVYPLLSWFLYAALPMHRVTFTAMHIVLLVCAGTSWWQYWATKKN